MNKSYFYDNSNLISRHLRRIRKEQKLSQEALAAQMQLLGVDINQRLISKIERNERFVKDYELACFCQILNVTERELLADFYEIRIMKLPSHSAPSPKQAANPQGFAACFDSYRVSRMVRSAAANSPGLSCEGLCPAPGITVKPLTGASMVSKYALLRLVGAMGSASPSR